MEDDEVYRKVNEDNYTTISLQKLKRKLGNKEELEENWAEIKEVPITCLNCGFRSLLVDFLLESNSFSGQIDSILYIKSTKLKNRLTCPKCRSNYCGYRDKDVKDLIADLL